MFTQILLKNFKLYQDATSFDHLKKINLLTGINGRGKSTLLQALLLMKQSIMKNSRNTSLSLNGEYVNLGNAFDIKNIHVSRSVPTLMGFVVDGYTVSYHFAAEENRQNMDLITCEIIPANRDSGPSFFFERDNCRSMQNMLPVAEGIPSLNFDRIQYVSAERIGPQLHYPLYDKDVTVGAKGEYTASQFYLHQADILSERYFEELDNMFENLKMDDIDRTMGGQVEFWLSKMFSKTTIDTTYIEEANVVTLQISTVQNGSLRMKPTNVGFGYTYVLPILVAGLIGQPGDTLIIENPEAHLHPAAQSFVGRFLALITQLGVQVFVESHSEHILNAFRVLIAQNILDKEDLNIMYFDDEYTQYYRTIPVGEMGKISEWPSHFFDQAEKDLDILLTD